MLHIKEIKPLFTNLLVTGNMYEEDIMEGNVIVAYKGDLKLYQTVLAVGSMIRDIKVGDQVMINPDNYKVTKYDSNSVKEDLGMNKIVGYNMPWVTMDDSEGNSQKYLLLKDRDIEFVFVGEEKSEPESSLILPKPKKIITS